MTRRRAARLAAIAILVLAIAPLAWRWGSGNFGAVRPGVYRSGQLSAAGLERTIRAYRVRTVLNLRGTNASEAWYRRERAAALRAGATLVDLPMASDQWLARDQARTLVDVLDSAEKPLLVHCEWGAERTGLASAFAVLLQAGATVDQARAQFSPYYLFAPMKDGLVMRGHVDAYRAWLEATGQAHDRAAFLKWIASGYRPAGPLSREFWPAEPYPLKREFRKEGEAVREVAVWSRDRPPMPSRRR